MLYSFNISRNNMIRTISPSFTSLYYYVVVTIIFLQLTLIQFTNNNHVVVDAKVCVATAQDRYLCTDDIAKANAYKWKDSPEQSIDVDSWDFGVEQEIGGTEIEKEGVTRIIREMKEYFITEVFAKSEYDAVLHKCKNKDKLCAFWASLNECNLNRGFMMNACPAACRMCLTLLSKK